MYPNGPLAGVTPIADIGVSNRSFLAANVCRQAHPSSPSVESSAHRISREQEQTYILLIQQREKTSHSDSTIPTGHNRQK
jgi:hypothetical protein